MKNKVLVIAPHADDEIIGCGATIAKHVQEGDEVHIVIATNASKGAPELFSDHAVKKTRDEAIKAHQSIGVTNTLFLEFPAPALNAYPEYKISLELSKIIHNFQPTYLYIPHPGDLHQDHKAIYRAALVAARPQGVNKIHTILCYETLSETEWTPMHEKPFVPNYFVDVTDYFDNKLDALKYFKSQLKEFPHSRSLIALESLAQYRGATIGVEKAEAFILERQINI